MKGSLEKPDDKTTTVTIDGPLTIEQVGRVRQDLLDKVAGTPGDVVIEFGDQIVLDVAGLQLLCSMHRSCLEKGIHLFLGDGPVRPQVLQFLEAVGMYRNEPCRNNAQDSCLWAQGKRT